MMKVEYGLGLSAADIPHYDPTRFWKIEEVFSAMFCGNYLSKLGFPLSVMEQLGDLVSDRW